jgi:hypothetical protein
VSKKGDSFVLETKDSRCQLPTELDESLNNPSATVCHFEEFSSLKIYPENEKKFQKGKYQENDGFIDSDVSVEYIDEKKRKKKERR